MKIDDIGSLYRFSRFKHEASKCGDRKQYEHAQNFDYKKLARSRAREINIAFMAHSLSWLRHGPFKPEAGVRTSYALPPRTFISFPFFFWSAR